MGKSYDELEIEQMVKAKQQAAEYEAQRRAQAKTAAENSDKVYDARIDSAERQYKASAKETESGYRKLYDANVVSELIARRNVDEAMANMGLQKSGLNATQQTALSLQRSNADYNTSEQKQKAVDAIMRELDAVRSQYESEKTAASNNIYAAADADILGYKAAAEDTARQNAASMYSAQVEADNAAADRAWDLQLLGIKQGFEAEQAQLDREHDYSMTDLQYASKKELESAAYKAGLNEKEADAYARWVLEGKKPEDYQSIFNVVPDNPYDSIADTLLSANRSNDENIVNELVAKVKVGANGDRPVEEYLSHEINRLINDGKISSSSARAYYEAAMAALPKPAAGVTPEKPAAPMVKTAADEVVKTPDQARYSGEVGPFGMHRTYEDYVVSALMDATASGKITADRAAEIAIEIEAKHRVNIDFEKALMAYIHPTD